MSKEFSYEEARRMLNRWANPVQAMQVAYAKGLKDAGHLPSPDYQRQIETVCDWIKSRFSEQFIPASVVNAAEELSDIFRALPAQQESVCEWVNSDDDRSYATGCGHCAGRHQTWSGDCPYCGRLIKLAHKGKEEG